MSEGAEPGGSTPSSRWRRCRCFSSCRAARSRSPAAARPRGWKAELLASAGARVGRLCGRAVRRARARSRRGASPSRSSARRWRAEDLVRAPRSRFSKPRATTEASAFRDAARAAGAAVNVSTGRNICDFSFGTIVNRSPLVVAISTDGAAPVFAQAIRARLEALLPPSFAQMGRGGARMAAPVAALGLDFRQRRTFWERFAELALRAERRRPRRPAISTRWRPRATRARRRRAGRSCWSAPGRAIPTSSP